MFRFKCKTEYDISYFIHVDVKKSIQHIGLEYLLFSHIIKIKRTIVASHQKRKGTKKSQNQTNLQKKQYLNLRVSQHYQQVVCL